MSSSRLSWNLLKSMTCSCCCKSGQSIYMSIIRMNALSFPLHHSTRPAPPPGPAVLPPTAQMLCLVPNQIRLWTGLRPVAVRLCLCGKETDADAVAMMVINDHVCPRRSSITDGHITFVSTTKQVHSQPSRHTGYVVPLFYFWPTVNW